LKTLVLTGWAGVLHAQMAAHTLPILHAYAERHGHAFGCANLIGERPASWMKVMAMHQALRNHDRMVWIDCDVVVVDPAHDILAELGDGWQGIVEHQTECGTVPNAGVWIVTQAMVPVLEDMWNSGGDVAHPWWEQAALMRRMGYAITAQPAAKLDTPTTLYRNTTFLAPTWNHHPRDARRVDSPRFVHVTQYADRLATVRAYAAAATGVA
jgi:hypothetical protein